MAWSNNILRVCRAHILTLDTSRNVWMAKVTPQSRFSPPDQQFTCLDLGIGLGPGRKLSLLQC